MCTDSGDTEKLRVMFESLHLGVEPHDENNGLKLPKTQEERKVLGEYRSFQPSGCHQLRVLLPAGILIITVVVISIAWYLTDNLQIMRVTHTHTHVFHDKSQLRVVYHQPSQLFVFVQVSFELFVTTPVSFGLCITFKLVISSSPEL